METGAQIFRRAAMGGFNRQDVLEYIETTARTAAQQVEALKKENALLKAERERAAAENQGLTERVNTAEQRLEETATKLSETGGALLRIREALSHEQAEAASLRAALNELREKTASMESGAAAYAELRDRTGTIELEAHQRALLIEQAAEERAKAVEREGAVQAGRLRTEAEQLIFKVRAEYIRLREGLDSAAAAAVQELGRVGETLEGVKADLSAYDEAFERLLASCHHQEVHTGAPDPLPLEEDE